MHHAVLIADLHWHSGAADWPTVCRLCFVCNTCHRQLQGTKCQCRPPTSVHNWMLLLLQANFVTRLVSPSHMMYVDPAHIAH